MSKALQEMVQLYVNQDYFDDLYRRAGPTGSLMELVFMDGVEFGYKLAKQERPIKALEEAGDE
jgi:hypothetical protein